MTITEKECDRLLALSERATAGEWWFDSYNTIFAGLGADGSLKQICAIPDHPKDGEWYEAEQIKERSEWYAESEANACLIIEARTALPALVRDLKAAMEACEYVYQEHYSRSRPCGCNICERHRAYHGAPADAKATEGE